MREVLIETIAVMKGNKLRIVLSGFAIAWGIFIFIVLISAGRGLLNGMRLKFRTYNVGIVTLYPRETSQPFEGQSKGGPSGSTQRMPPPWTACSAIRWCRSFPW